MFDVQNRSIFGELSERAIEEIKKREKEKFDETNVWKKGQDSNCSDIWPEY